MDEKEMSAVRTMIEHTAERAAGHARQQFFDAVIRAIDVHLPGTPHATKVAIATDAALFGKERGPG